MDSYEVPTRVQCSRDLPWHLDRAREYQTLVRSHSKRVPTNHLLCLQLVMGSPLFFETLRIGL